MNSRQKRVGRWTGAAERTVKNWAAGASLPNGYHLIALIARSGMVLEMVLAASRRIDLLEAFLALQRLPIRPAKRRGADKRVTGDGTNDDPSDGSARKGDHGSAAMVGRRRWFLAELLAGADIGATNLIERFGVSSRTAKRDIAALRRAGVVRYEGTTRKSRYVPQPARPR